MSYRLTKGVFFFFNFLQLVIAIALIIIGCLILSMGLGYDVDKLYKKMNLILPLMCVLIGVLAIIFTAVGYVGANSEKKSILFVYGGLTYGMLMTHITIIVLMTVYASELHQHTLIVFKDTFRSYAYPDGNWWMNDNMDDMQQFGECCGVNGYEDWKDWPWNGVGNGCCVNRTFGCGIGYFIKPPSQRPEIYTEGCAMFAAIWALVLSLKEYLLTCVIGAMALSQIISSNAAFFLIRSQEFKSKSQSTMKLNPM